MNVLTVGTSSHPQEKMYKMSCTTCIFPAFPGCSNRYTAPTNIKYTPPRLPLFSENPFKHLLMQPTLCGNIMG